MSTIVIDITPPGGATEDITNLVLFEKTNFTSQVNGAPGECLVRVKDTLHTEIYKTGSVIRLTVDGVLRWGGFLMKATRTWPLPVMKTTNPQTTARYIELAGMDYNLLFQKRILRYLSTPANPVFKLYAAGSYDDDIINDVLTNFTEILSEGFTKSISRVGIAIYDIGGITVGGRRSTGGIVWNAADRLADMFASVARATSGIYYITPDKVITYCDVDSPTSSYKLTDTPAGGSDIGYRELKLTESGDALVNDALVWGAALGANHMVFERVQDATSIATHGMWQAGNFSQGLYKATSATFVANTMVNGTPSSKRGAKDDKRSFEVKTVGALFNLGDKVDCVSNVWGFDMVLPVRKITYTFPTPTAVFQQLTLSYEVDQPFDIYESLFPPFGRIGGFNSPRIQPIIIGGGPTLPPFSETCCPIDLFERTVALNVGGFGSFPWGTYTDIAGAVWNTPFLGQFSVNGHEGVLGISDASNNYDSYVKLPLAAVPSISYEVTAFFNITPLEDGAGGHTGAVGNTGVFYFGTDSGVDGVQVQIHRNTSGTPTIDLYGPTSSTPDATISAPGLDLTVPFTFTVDCMGAGSAFNLRFGGSVVHFNTDSTIVFNQIACEIFTGNVGAQPLVELHVAEIRDCSTNTICTDITPEFDTFLDRVTTSTLGNTSGAGRAWVTEYVNGFTSYGVSDFGIHNGGFVNNNGGPVSQARFYVTPIGGDPWTTGADFYFRVHFSYAGATPGFFHVRLQGPDAGIQWGYFAGNIIVDDGGNGWTDSGPPGFTLSPLPNHEYVLEGYAKQTIGAGARIYEVGTSPPAWVFPSAGNTVGGPTAEFAYDDGSLVGLTSTTQFAIAEDGVSSPSEIFWHDVWFQTCAPCSGGSGGGGPAPVPLTGYVTETAVDSGDHQLFTVSRSIAPGSERVTIDGINRHDYTVTPATGKITFTAPLPSGTSAPVVTYIAQYSPPPITGAWADKPAFLSYPSSGGPLTFTGISSDIVVSGKSFTGITYNNAALRFDSCTGNILVHDCDFNANEWDAIDVISCTGNIVVEWCRFGAFTPSSHGGRLYPDVMQLATSTMTGTFRNNKVKLDGYHEDILNFYQSGGPSAVNRFEVAYNAIEGGIPISSGSGTGSLLADNSDATHGHIWVHDNTYYNPGQVGVGISEGVDCHVNDNIIYQDTHTNGNVGIYTPYVGGSPNPGGHEVARNRVWYKNSSGTLNALFDGGASGTVAGLSPQTNTFDDTTIDPSTLVVTL